jgi:RNA polymerase sigma-70 factor, ECF subfamily
LSVHADVLPDSERARSSAPPPALDGQATERLRALFDQHYDALYRFLRRMGLDGSLADDGAQEAFVVVSRRLSDIELHKERAFLFATGVRIARRLREYQGRQAELPEDAPPPSSSSNRIDELVERKRQRDLLDRVLATMEEDLRVVLVLTEIEGYGKREVAEMLEIPEGTAASRLRRARDDFKQRLRAEVGS